jgi:hypothetical protein
MAVVDTTIPQIIKVDRRSPGEQRAKKVATCEKKQKNKDLQRTRLCVYNLGGKCGYGSKCTFAHNASEVKNVPDLRKTQVCTKFAEGKCTNKNCNYAHGEAELKDPPNFKKKLCKWHSMGNCRNGASCGFAHEIKELRAEAPPGFEPIGAEAPLNAKKLQKVAPPPGLTKMGVEYDCDASTDVPSSQSQAESDLSMTGVPSIPEEQLFRFMAGRGSAPLQHQVVLMSSAIGGLQAKLSQLEDKMLENQVAQMQQQIEMLTKQCITLESGLAMAQTPAAPVAPTSLRMKLSSKATPFNPVGPDGSDDSTSVGSE